MGQVIVLRHAQWDFVTDAILPGQDERVAALARVLPQPDRIIASTTCRAQQTALALGRGDPSVDSRLDEVDILPYLQEVASQQGSGMAWISRIFAIPAAHPALTAAGQALLTAIADWGRQPGLTIMISHGITMAAAMCLYHHFPLEPASPRPFIFGELEGFRGEVDDAGHILRLEVFHPPATLENPLSDPDIALLAGALNLESVSGQEAVVAQWLANEMARRGITARVDGAGNAVGELGSGRPHILLLGHIDTVPGMIPVVVRQGKLYGRGAVDAKGPFCAFIAAAARLAHIWEPPKRITIVGAVEEEAASSKGARFILDHYDPDMVVIGEPSGWDAITLGYKGRLLVHFSTTRPIAHTAGRDPAVAEEAVEFWLRVREWAHRWNDTRAVHFGQWAAVDPSLRHLVTTVDGFVQRAEGLIGLRLPLGLSPAEARSAIGALADRVEITFSGDEEAVKAEKTTPLVRAFLLAIREEGGEPRFKVKTGTSDMNVVASRWRVPMLAYGPGDSTLDHTPQEHIEIAEYKRGISVLERVLRSL